ncbi:MAG: CvpA family protein [Acidobacteria bacterium]|nr:CvpA family protein [Acidobacteriota bacterium]
MVDLIAVAVLALLVIRGWARGFVREAIDVVTLVLGAILLDNTAYNQAASVLTSQDFSLDSNRRIFRRIAEMAEQ